MNESSEIISIEVEERPIYHYDLGGTVYPVRKPKPDHLQAIFGERSELKELMSAHNSGGDLSKLSDPAGAGISSMWAMMKVFLMHEENYIDLRKRIYGDIDDDVAADVYQPTPDQIRALSSDDDNLTMFHVIKWALILREKFFDNDPMMQEMQAMASRKRPTDRQPRSATPAKKATAGRRA